MPSRYFKQCPRSHKIWASQNEFMADDRLEINGYTADFEKLEYGLFFFTHTKKDCFSTLTIEVKDFRNLYKGKIHLERRTLTPDCPRYCLKKDQLDRCDAMCGCALVREIIQVIRERRSV